MYLLQMSSFFFFWNKILKNMLSIIFFFFSKFIHLFLPEFSPKKWRPVIIITSGAKSVKEALLTIDSKSYNWLYIKAKWQSIDWDTKHIYKPPVFWFLKYNTLHSWLQGSTQAVRVHTWSLASISPHTSDATLSRSCSPFTCNNKQLNQLFSSLCHVSAFQPDEWAKRQQVANTTIYNKFKN